jgi:hypothetical protein
MRRRKAFRIRRGRHCGSGPGVPGWDRPGCVDGREGSRRRSRGGCLRGLIPVAKPKQISLQNRQVLEKRAAEQLQGQRSIKPPREYSEARVQKWEARLTSQRVFEDTLVGFAGPQGAPVWSMSLIPFSKQQNRKKDQLKKEKREKESIGRSTTRKALKNGVSYAHCLYDKPALYNPQWLDDNTNTSEEHRVEMTLPGFKSSVMLFTKRKQAKKKLNKEFRVKHPWLRPDMTLSKIRKVRQDLMAVAVQMDFEYATAALAYVYFEKAVMLNAVEKSNRKLVASTALLLAYKYNEPVVTAEEEAQKRKMEPLFDCLTQIFFVKHADVLGFEFTLFSLLQFELDMDMDTLTVHLARMLLAAGLS